MARYRWPAPVRTLRGYLPAEMRVLRGGLGAVGGVVLLVSILSILLGGNWRLSYSDDRIFVTIFVVLIPAGVGIASPLWYWVSRPIWAYIDRPGNRFLRRFEAALFLPGLAGSVLGTALLFPVRATSGLLIQMLAPFGLAIAVGTPLWYWVFRPAGVRRFVRRLPEAVAGTNLTSAVIRSLLVLGILFGVSLTITSVIALPIVDTGDHVTKDGLSVTITDTETVQEITESESGETHGDDSWQLLLVRVDVENRGQTPRQLPGASVGDFAVISPVCSAQTFGEPADNCNQVYVDGNFTANATTYVNYDTRLESSDETIDAGSRTTGWLVFYLESQPPAPPEFDSMVIVDDFGRWRLGE